MERNGAMEKGANASMSGLKTQSLIQAANPKHLGATAWEQAVIILFLLSDDAFNITGAAYDHGRRLECLSMSAKKTAIRGER